MNIYNKTKSINFMLFNTDFSQIPQKRKSLFLTSSFQTQSTSSSNTINPSSHSFKRTDTMDIVLEEETQYVPKISIQDINGRNMLYNNNINVLSKKLLFNLQKKECFSCNYH